MSAPYHIFVYYNDNSFVDIAKSVHNALNELNVSNTLIDYLDTKKFKPNDIYIILGLNKQVGHHLPPHYIAYQLEQTGNDISWFNEGYLRRLNHSMEIWDYSLRNIQNCKKYNLTPKQYYVPLGYMPNLEKSLVNETKYSPQMGRKKYDVLFYGSSNRRRDQMIENLRKAGLRVYYGQYNVWANERDKLVQQSRIVLNIHYYEEPVLETSRLTYLLANKAFIISEPSQDAILDRNYQGLVKFAPYHKIVETCKYYIQHEEERESFIGQAHETFKKKNDYINTIRQRLAIFQNPPQKLEIEKPLYVPSKAIKKSPTSTPTPTPTSTPKPKFKKAVTEIEDGGMVLKLGEANNPYLEGDPPKVTLVTPTANRSWAIDLCIRNFYGFKYPQDKLEWIILDYHPTENVTLPPDPRIRYVELPSDQEDLPLWEKRNRLAEMATGDIIIHMDDDDYYFPNSIWAKVKLLYKYFNLSQKNIKATQTFNTPPKTKPWHQTIGCVGCTELGVYHMIDNYSYLVQTKYISEASMAYTKKFWQEKQFNGTDHPELGEGYSFLAGREYKTIDFPYMFNFIANTHTQNVTGKLRTYRDQSQESYDNFFNLWDTETQIFFLELKRKLTKAQKTNENT
jgi:glycosyltransferase involved in cell wall biosynthesis